VTFNEPTSHCPDVSIGTAIHWLDVAPSRSGGGYANRRCVIAALPPTLALVFSFYCGQLQLQADYQLAQLHFT
jgi:hypothetical protein